MLPDDLCRMIDSGLISRLRDPDDELYIYDMRIFPVDRMVPSILTEGQFFEITPIAKNGAGDYYGYISHELPDSIIYLFPHDDSEVDYEATTIVDLVYRQTIYFCHCQFIADGEVALEEARREVANIQREFRSFFSADQQKTLDDILSRPPHETLHRTLISKSTASVLLEDSAVHGEERLWFDDDYYEKL